MIEIKDKSKCCGCGACLESCPNECISFVLDEEGFWYPQVDYNRCVDCGVCETVCPFLQTAPIDFKPLIVASKAKDNNTRYWSSSGGVFPILASKVLSNKGIVFGVSMSDDCLETKHTSVESIEELAKIKGSKYIPSRANVVYKTIKNLLQQNKKVLFSGVPCQIAGLKKFLGTDYDNLYTIEIICHGVVSPLVWKKYVFYWEDKHKRKVAEVSFRSKLYSWDSFPNKGKKTSSYFDFSFSNPYFKIFNSSMALRPSCYNCLAKQGNCMSDIALGDFWGINNFSKGFDDGNGVSLVCINSKKGLLLFNEVADYLDCFNSSLSFDDVAKINPGLLASKPFDSRRETFYRDLNSLEFKALINKYVKNQNKVIIKSHLMKTKAGDFILKLFHKNYQISKYGVLITSVSKDK